MTLTGSKNPQITPKKPMACFCYLSWHRNKTMITIQDFRSASFEKKCDVVTTQSNYITSRNMGNCKVYLYHTGEYFIEVFYSPIYKKVLMINAFNDNASLVPYAEKVSLAELGFEGCETK